jgi:hypothetical protein
LRKGAMKGNVRILGTEVEAPSTNIQAPEKHQARKLQLGTDALH